MKRKPIIVIDGADGSGKSTQIEELKKYYAIEKSIQFSKFPVYESETGFFVTQYLDGLFEPLKKNFDSPLDYYKNISMLYAMDRVLWFKTHYDPNNTYIFDRYTTSNMIHIGTHLADSNLANYLDWIEKLEYESLDILKPDLVIYLTLPANITMKNLIHADKKLDIHENIDHAIKVQCISQYLAEKKGWYIIDCYNKETCTMHDIGYITTLIIHAIDKFMMGFETA